MDVADQQALWLLLGLAAFALTLLIVRDDRQLDAYTYTIGLLGLMPAAASRRPGVGLTINGARLWAAIGPFTFQPAEFGKILIVIFLASTLSAKRELLEAGVGRLGLFRARRTWARCCPPGAPRSRSCSWSATSGPRCWSSASSS